MLRSRTLTPVLALAALILAARPAYMPTLAPAENAPQITLAAVGDVLLDRGIGRGIRRFGVEWPFEKVTSILESADLAFCNLECPLSRRGIRINKPVCFQADPDTVGCLKDAGLDLVSLANNHTLDCGRRGLTETMATLDDAGIGHVGAGATVAEAAQPVILDIDGIRVAVLARNGLLPECVWYRTDAPNIAPLDPDTIEQEVAAAARQADVVIVSIHWGVEYRQHPQPEQEDLAHRIIDAGADVILGHHPHVIQPIEEYHGGLIAYSLGNFLFDNPRRQCCDTLILECRLTKSGLADYEVVPVEIRDRRPVPAPQPHAAERD
jgi:poly-gamma-glutamate capsule biosynthesis protein CapA/YwtB (metallophosphatase superfamily)